VETFLNLLWVAVAVALAILWSLKLRKPRPNSSLPAVQLQVASLAVLSLVLLPVISLPDDLQAAANPAETEHFWRRGDPQAFRGQPLHTPPIALAPLNAAAPEPPVHAPELIAKQHPAPLPVEHRVPDLPSRAPPAA
jgi:hypothetical protein